VEWLEGLADGLGHQANFVQAIEVAEQMRGLAERLGDNLALARAWNHLAYLQERRGDNRASVLASEQAERFAANCDSNGRREQIRALYLKGWALYRLADWEPVLALATRTATLCAECGDRPGLANSCKLHGVVHLQYGHYTEADRYFEQGLALSLETGDRRNAGAMWSNLGESARLRGDFATAVGFYQKALGIARQIGHRESETIYLSNLSGARVGLGEFEQAEAGLREAIKLSTGAKSGFLSEALSFLAEACLGQEKTDDARDAAQRGLALARESENELDYAFAWRVLGRVNARGRPELVTTSASRSESTSPEACFAESLRLFKKINADAEQARTLRAWAEYERRRGHAASAEKMNIEARAIFERLNMAAEIARTPLADEVRSP
jgi:tetratricopeptide (TPR) repeat protein